MTEHLLASLGIYGACALISFVAGLIPIASIEVFMIAMSAVRHPGVGEIALCCVLAAIGHQVAKTICYYGGVGALEHGKLKPKIDKIRPRLERWNKAPKLVMFLAATVGLPPMYIMAFIAHPLMKMHFWVFTAICFFGRIGRYFVIAVVPLMF